MRSLERYFTVATWAIIQLKFRIHPTFTEDLSLKKAVDGAYPLSTEFHVPLLTDERPEYMSIFIKSGENLTSAVGAFDRPTAVVNYGPSQQARCREGLGSHPEWNSMFKFNFRDEVDAEDLTIDVVDMNSECFFFDLINRCR